MKNNRLQRLAILLPTLMLVLLLFTGCSPLITWEDADGTVLETMIPEEGQEIAERPLPADDDQWHYTGWTESTRGNKTTYTAERIAKLKVIWIDAEGTVLHTSSVIPDEEPKVYPLPMDTDEWLYTGWAKESRDGELIYTAERTAKTKICWRDADGTLIHTESILPGGRIPDRSLPTDSAAFVYTGWEQKESENTITLTAKRVPAKTVIWCDADGTKIETQYLPYDQQITERAFPSSQKWDYSSWKRTFSGSTYTYTAIGTPKTSYFIGNVFQIVAKDLTENPLSLGTGFVINNQGWFITNYHVLDEACLADAVFQIKNYATSESYTTLSIEKISYYDKDKDIIIGKLENYASIASYYQRIPLQTNYNVGDLTYSVGYPDGIENMEINEGEILRGISTLRDKLYSGIGYIASDSYIAPGSSGGVLVNEKLEVIGMTTLGLWDDDEEFVLGAAIEAFNFQGLITTKTKSSMLQTLATVMYPELSEYVKLLEKFKRNEMLELIEEEGVYLYKMESVFSGKSDDGDRYTETETYLFYGNGYIFVDFVVEWEGGDVREALLYGNYLDGLDSFYYIYDYTFADGKGYTLYSDNINYSPYSSQTLSRYSVQGHGGFYPGSGNITYAKERFNEIYIAAKNLLF